MHLSKKGKCQCWVSSTHGDVPGSVAAGGGGGGYHYSDHTEQVIGVFTFLAKKHHIHPLSMYSFSPSLVFPGETSCWRKIPTAPWSLTLVKGEFGPRTELLELPGDRRQVWQIISYQGKEMERRQNASLQNSLVSKY